MTCDDSPSCSGSAWNARGRVAAAAVAAAPHDVAYVTLSEPHCIGHHFWHLHDETSPFRWDDVPADLSGVVREFYRHTDHNIGLLVEAAGAGATVIVHLSHGMRHQLSGPQLLPVLLERLGYGTGEPPYNRYRHLVPGSVRRLMKRVLPRSFVDSRRLDARELSAPGTRAVVPGNNQVGAIRLGIAGRDPGGVVEPAEVPREIARLTSILEGLTQPSSGERIVEEVIDTRARWGDDCHDNIPDILVGFRRDLGPLEAADVPGHGTIERSVQFFGFARTGDHVPGGRLVVHAPDRDLSAVRARASNVDLGPTMMALLGLDVPDDLDGRPIAEVVGALDPPPRSS